MHVLTVLLGLRLVHFDIGCFLVGCCKFGLRGHFLAHILVFLRGFRGSLNWRSRLSLKLKRGRLCFEGFGCHLGGLWVLIVLIFHVLVLSVNAAI